MLKKYWGGTVPLLNMLISPLLFATVKWRIATLRVKNRIRSANKAPPAWEYSKCQAQVQHWLSKGFNRLNVGGGAKNLAAFVNVDFVSHQGVEREIVADILDLSFVPSGSMSQIHSNHVIEHLSDSQLRDQLRGYHRILNSNGTLSIRCPSALGACYAFWFEPILEDDKDEFVALGFPGDEDFHNPADGWLHKDVYGFLHWIYADVGNIKNQHLNLITPTKISGYLESEGFEILKISAPEALNIALVARKRSSPLRELG